MTAKHASDTPITDAIDDKRGDHEPYDRLYYEMCDHAVRMERDRTRLIEALRIAADGLRARGAFDNYAHCLRLLRELGEGEAA